MSDKIYISQIPKLMDEWDLDKNNAIGLTPSKLLLRSNKKAWWKCSVCGNEWQAMVSHRTLRGSGCPQCAKV